MNQIPQAIIRLLNDRNTDGTPTKPLLIITAEQRVGKTSIAQCLSDCITDVAERYVISDVVRSDEFVNFTAKVHAESVGYRQTDNTILDCSVDDLGDSDLTVLDSLIAIEDDMIARRSLANENLEEYKRLSPKLLVLDEGMDFAAKLNKLPKSVCDKYQLDQKYWGEYLKRLLSKAGRAKYIIFYITHSLTSTSAGISGLHELYSKQPLIELYLGKSIPQNLKNRGVNISDEQRLGVFKPRGSESEGDEVFFIVPKYEQLANQQVSNNERYTMADCPNLGQTGTKHTQNNGFGLGTDWGRPGDDWTQFRDECLKIGDDWLKTGDDLEEFGDELRKIGDDFGLFGDENARNLYAAVVPTSDRFKRWFLKNFPKPLLLHFRLGDKRYGKDTIKSKTAEVAPSLCDILSNNSVTNEFCKLRTELLKTEWITENTVKPQQPNNDLLVLPQPLDPKQAEFRQKVDRKKDDKLADRVATAELDTEVIQPLRQQYDWRIVDAKNAGRKEVFDNLDESIAKRAAAMGVAQALKPSAPDTPLTFEQRLTVRQMREDAERKHLNHLKNQHLAVAISQIETESSIETKGLALILAGLVAPLLLLFTFNHNLFTNRGNTYVQPTITRTHPITNQQQPACNRRNPYNPQALPPSCNPSKTLD